MTNDPKALEQACEIIAKMGRAYGHPTERPADILARALTDAALNARREALEQAAQLMDRRECSSDARDLIGHGAAIRSLAAPREAEKPRCDELQEALNEHYRAQAPERPEVAALVMAARGVVNSSCILPGCLNCDKLIRALAALEQGSGGG